TIAKALSGGMVPVGATICKRWIYDKVFSKMERCVVHSSTFGQNNLAMVCGLAALDIIEEEKLLENARNVGSYLLEKLQELAKESEWIKEVRGKGLMIGIEFGKPSGFKNKLAWNMVHSMDKGLFGELIVIPLLSKHNILTQVSGHHQDIVKLIPPLTITKEHADKFVAALKDVLADCGKIAGPIWEMGKNLMKQASQQQQQ
ncbi:aminotransferase class III-fold pyridoxal phosphate-dependent enzyme, partial [bacterium]|nr:aminotransferase class III-fold pyridoxal phosphate-dependent enzyme [bacterium]